MGIFLVFYLAVSRMLMRGGRIRGQGTYGCVFQPPLLCRGEKLNGAKVGKITMPEDAKNELAIAKILADIPDAPKYTLAPEPASCKPRAPSKQKNKNLGACEFVVDRKLTDTIQLIMPWGGYPLSRIDLDPAKFDFTKFMEEILAIGAFLAINDLCHFDIWGQNFLFDSKNTPRLIDFGFTFRPSELTAEGLKFRWRQLAVDHDTEAPEVAVMQAVDKDITPTEVISALQEQKPAVQRLALICNVQPSEWAEELKAWADDSQAFQSGDWLMCWKLYWPGFDAWGIVAVLLEVLEIQMSARAFLHNEAFAAKEDLIKDVLRGMSRGHPAYRLDAVEALSLLTGGSSSAHPLVSAGSAGAAWVQKKEELRRRLV
jgi:hypothetical protein